MIVSELKADRIVIFLNSADADWICLRVCLFHYTLFKTDVLDILDIAGYEVPKWLSEVLTRAVSAEYRPIPEAPFPQSLPSLQTIRDLVPHVIEPGMSYPVFDGGQAGGLIINPGGEATMQEIPYRAKMRSWTFLGLNLWLQSGMLNGAACLVSQALLYYQKESLTPAYYPLLSIAGFVPGKLGMGAQIYHRPDLEESDLFAGESGYAHNMIRFYPGYGYDVSRNFFLDCPVPEYPTGHFMRPRPGQQFNLGCLPGVVGRYRMELFDAYHAGDSLDTVPFGCFPGWPSDEFLAPYGLTNEDGAGIYSISDILGLGGAGSPLRHAMPTSSGFGDVIVQEALSGSLSGQRSIFPVIFSLFRAFGGGATRLPGVGGADSIHDEILLDGEPLTLAGDALFL